jgi:serine protease Do
MRASQTLALILASLAGTIPVALQAQPPKLNVTVSPGGYLGVMLQEIDGDRAKALKLPEEAGVEVTRIDPDSPADRAGLKVGDVVVRYNGQRVEGMEQFSRFVRETPTGREVKLEIVRNGTAQTMTARISARRNAVFVPDVRLDLPAPPAPPLPPDIPRTFLSWRSAVLGIEAESLTGQLAEFFGVKQGVLVRSVISGAAAEKAGIKAGDVITRVGDSTIATPADVSSRIRASRGKTVTIMLTREHKDITVIVNISNDDRAEISRPGPTQEQ